MGEANVVLDIRELPQAVSIPLGQRGNCTVPGKTERSVSQTLDLSTVKVVAELLREKTSCDQLGCQSAQLFPVLE